MSFLQCITLHLRIGLMLAAIAVTSSAPLQAAQAGHQVIGDWRFTSILDNVEITSIDDEQARKYLGRVMEIRMKGIRFGDQTCGAPSFAADRVEPNFYVSREARISADKLGLPNPVTVVDVDCTRIFIKKRNRAVIFWDGFFFGAEKVK